jgi:hypothetical protein
MVAASAGGCCDFRHIEGRSADVVALRPGHVGAIGALERIATSSEVRPTPTGTDDCRAQATGDHNKPATMPRDVQAVMRDAATLRMTGPLQLDSVPTREVSPSRVRGSPSATRHGRVGSRASVDCFLGGPWGRSRAGGAAAIARAARGRFGAPMRCVGSARSSRAISRRAGA